MIKGIYCKSTGCQCSDEQPITSQSMCNYPVNRLRGVPSRKLSINMDKSCQRRVYSGSMWRTKQLKTQLAIICGIETIWCFVKVVAHSWPREPPFLCFASAHLHKISEWQRERDNECAVQLSPGKGRQATAEQSATRCLSVPIIQRTCDYTISKTGGSESPKWVVHSLLTNTR